MEPRFEKIYCERCGKEETYKYSGGPKRKKCFGCKPKRVVKYHLNAYDDFSWGPLSNGWYPTKSGNIQKWFGKRLAVIHRQAGVFVLWRPRYSESLKSEVRVSIENVPQIISLAEKWM